MFDDAWIFGIQKITTHLAIGALGAMIIWLPTKIRRVRLRGKVEEAYRHVKHTYEPETLNPEHPGNPHTIAATARDYVNLLRPKLKRAGLYPPEAMTTSEDSKFLWFHYLSGIRPEL